MNRNPTIKAIAVIPARGGSKGIPRKNLRDLNGVPLIAHTIRTALESGCFDVVVVSTEDEEIAHVAAEFGARVHPRPPHLADDRATLDPVVYDAVRSVSEEFDIAATLQPTCPLLGVETLRAAFRRMAENPEIDTLISVVNDPRLAWVEKDSRIVPAYEKRVNRQELPPYYRETGAFFLSRMRCVAETSRFGPNVAVFPIPEEEALDIDTMRDWWIAEKTLESRRVAIRAAGNRTIGFGHIYRMLMIANRLLDHKLQFFIESSDIEAAQRVRDAFYPCCTAPANELPARIDEFRPDILINDILDTTPLDVIPYRERGVFVVNFEDLGEGLKDAHLVFNALYETDSPHSHVHTGPDYYCLRDEFAHTRPRETPPRVERILATFGGADPANLTLKTVRALTPLLEERQVDLRVVLGLAYPTESEAELRSEIEKSSVANRVTIQRDVKSMAAEFKSADLVLTSYGRTMYEVASMGTPAVLMAQNSRELHHVFGREENGFCGLGLGVEVSEDQLLETVQLICEDFELRKAMRDRMLKTDLSRGIRRVTKIILDAFEEAPKTVGAGKGGGLNG